MVVQLSTKSLFLARLDDHFSSESASGDAKEHRSNQSGIARYLSLSASEAKTSSNTQITEALVESYCSSFSFYSLYSVSIDSIESDSEIWV